MVTSKLTWKQEEILEKGKKSVLKPTHLVTNTTNIDFGRKTWITIVLGFISVIALQMTVIKEEKLGDFEKKGDH